MMKPHNNLAVKYVILLFLFGSHNVFAQGNGPARVHSHNDYEKHIPFWLAFSAGATSLEADVFLKDTTLYVAHEALEIQEGRTLENLYLAPLVRAMEAGFLEHVELQLLIDIKSEAYSTLDTVIRDLKKHPALLATSGLRFVISGNRPEIADYGAYPNFVWFDHQRLEGLEAPGVTDRIALISLNFTSVSTWNGDGPLSAVDCRKISAILQTAHLRKIPFRFWATPDTETAWRELTRMGVDFINTDKPFECVAFLNLLATKNE
jgi:alkaline phosphatase